MWVRLSPFWAGYIYCLLQGMSLFVTRWGCAWCHPCIARLAGSPNTPVRAMKTAACFASAGSVKISLKSWLFSPCQRKSRRNCVYLGQPRRAWATACWSPPHILHEHLALSSLWSEKRKSLRLTSPILVWIRIVANGRDNTKYLANIFFYTDRL